MQPIYLADLTHCTVTISNDAFPLNVGYVGAYVKKVFPEVQVELFKYPEDLKSAIDRKRPAILGCANYPWNLDLGVSFLRHAKSLDPRIVTVMGGPNISYRPDDQARLLARLDGVLDFYAMFEGESSFRSLLERLLACDFDLSRLKEQPIPGNLHRVDGRPPRLVPIERNRDLAAFPSPYLSGMMDKFFDDMLSPMIETHRGCPYSCTFCHEGHVAYSKLNRHPQERILEEIDYIAERVGTRVKNFMIADPNFGIFKQDVEVAEKIREVFGRTGYPKVVFATAAKNSKDRLLEMSRLLKPVSMPISMSVQSMTDEVLRAIKRRNIRTDQLVGVQHELQDLGTASKSELIMHLPGETFRTHVESINRLIELGMDHIGCYQLMQINGSELKDDHELQREHQFQSKYRVLPRNYSKLDGVGVSLETEEIVVASREFPFEDYLKARQLHLLISVFYNNGGFKGFFRYLVERRMDLAVFFERFLEAFGSDPELSRYAREFLEATRAELFDSEEEIRRFYSEPDSYARLVDGSAGANLLQRFACLLYMEKSDRLTGVIAKAMDAVDPGDDEFRGAVDCLSRYYHAAYQGFLGPERRSLRTEVRLEYDVETWLAQRVRPLASFRHAVPQPVTFHTPDEQYELVESYFGRYGRNPQAFGKIMTRLWIVDMLRRPLQASPSRDEGMEKATA
jgi:radical SAM superfamily enzyme YgiQ (UPF0313 family)